MNTVNLFYQTFWCVVLLQVFLWVVLCFDKPARLFQSKYRQRNIEFERRKQEVQFVKELIHFVVVSILDIFTETSVSLYLSMQNKQYWQIQFLFIGSSHNFITNLTPCFHEKLDYSTIQLSYLPFFLVSPSYYKPKNH